MLKQTNKKHTLVRFAGLLLIGLAAVITGTGAAEPENGKTEAVAPSGRDVLSAQEVSNGTKETISVDYKDETRGKILRDIADRYDLNVVISDYLFADLHKTNLKLNNVSWQQVYSAVLTPMDMGIMERDGILYVMTTDQIYFLETRRAEAEEKEIKKRIITPTRASARKGQPSGTASKRAEVEETEETAEVTAAPTASGDSHDEVSAFMQPDDSESLLPFEIQPEAEERDRR